MGNKVGRRKAEFDQYKTEWNQRMLCLIDLDWNIFFKSLTSCEEQAFE